MSKTNLEDTDMSIFDRIPGSPNKMTLAGKAKQQRLEAVDKIDENDLTMEDYTEDQDVDDIYIPSSPRSKNLTETIAQVIPSKAKINPKDFLELPPEQLDINDKDFYEAVKNKSKIPLDTLMQSLEKSGLNTIVGHNKNIPAKQPSIQDNTESESYGTNENILEEVKENITQTIRYLLEPESWLPEGKEGLASKIKNAGTPVCNSLRSYLQFLNKF